MSNYSLLIVASIEMDEEEFLGLEDLYLKEGWSCKSMLLKVKVNSITR